MPSFICRPSSRAEPLNGAAMPKRISLSVTPRTLGPGVAAMAGAGAAGKAAGGIAAAIDVVGSGAGGAGGAAGTAGAATAVAGCAAAALTGSSAGAVGAVVSTPREVIAASCGAGDVGAGALAKR